jgi:hypothetical protein
VKTERSVWLSNHLLDEPAGVAAHQRAMALGPESHEKILRLGDRLAEASGILAQQYYKRAGAAWDHFGDDGFLRWFSLGEELVQEPVSCREGAMAYFGVEPNAFGSRGLDSAADWCHLGCEVAAVSPKLAGIFFSTTVTLLRKPSAMERLPAWVEAGLGLYQHHGWLGEFLAQAFFAAAPKAVLVLGPNSYRLWAGAAAALYPVVKEREFFGALPTAIRRWSDSEKATFLRGTLSLAPVAPKQSFEFYRRLPASLQSLEQAPRELMVAILARAGKHIAAVIADIIPTAGALVRQIAEESRMEALGHVRQLGERYPEMVGTALRTLPRVYEEAEPDVVRRWFAKGLELSADNRDAGLAYFALESRTSARVLREGSTAATLEETQGLLRKYIQMLSGQAASLRGVERFGLRPPLEEFPSENEVAAPLRVDVLETHEDNARLYRYLASQLAGRREFGTYTFVPTGEPEDPEQPPGRSLFAYLEREGQPPMLEDLFLLAEGVRIQHRLNASYGGLATDARWVATRLLQRWAEETGPSRSTVFDGILALIVAGEGFDSVPAWLPPDVVTTLSGLLAPLALETATVQDSMRLAHTLGEVLERFWTRHKVIASPLDGLLLDKVTGDALLDSLLEYEEYGPSTEAPRMPSMQSGDDAKDVEIPPLQLDQEPDEGLGGGQAMSPEELKRLLEAGVKMEISQGSGTDVDGLGLYITDLLGKIPGAQLDELRELLGDRGDGPRPAPRRWLDDGGRGPFFLYDEWDYHISDYRNRWCRLREIHLDGDSGEFFNQALTDYSNVIPEVRRQFQRVRPEMYRTVRGLEDGEDFDLNAAIDARIEVLAGRAPSNKLYVARKREERDVATLFLVDMSASTDEPLVKSSSDEGSKVGSPKNTRQRSSRAGRRIIDVTKETLVIMAEALEEIGDAYAIYGFSGHGRDNVEVYRVKSFAEPLNTAVKGRMGGIEPKRSTRMGTALRHAVEKLSAVTSRSKHLFLLSDGFPQDYDYGQDRRSNIYGIRDTAVALREAEAAGVTPFCITVDKAGHDYLRQMCDESRYMVIDDITSLPRELPKIYQRVVRA